MEALLTGHGGNRHGWDEIPVRIRAAIERRLGDRVVEARLQQGGFSPAFAGRLRLAGGGRVFVKAGDGAAEPFLGTAFRQEAAVVAGLPTAAPVPRLRWWFADGDWVVLAFEEVTGHPPALPWRPADRDRVLDAITGLVEALTPAPPVPVPSLADDGAFSGFRTLAARGHERLAEAYPWVAGRLDQLADWEARWPAVAAGDTLVHGDLRADNLLLSGDRVVFVDWPSAARGVGWFDLVGFLPSLLMQGGGDGAAILARHPLTAYADEAALTAGLAAIAGYFVAASLEPAPPLLPRIREFQRAQAIPALDLLRPRL